ncbi:hypothetical protein HN51_059808 [Arachis hypogaea]
MELQEVSPTPSSRNHTAKLPTLRMAHLSRLVGSEDEDLHSVLAGSEKDHRRITMGSKQSRVVLTVTVWVCGHGESAEFDKEQNILEQETLKWVFVWLQKWHWQNYMQLNTLIPFFSPLFATLFS